MKQEEGAAERKKCQNTKSAFVNKKILQQRENSRIGSEKIFQKTEQMAMNWQVGKSQKTGRSIQDIKENERRLMGGNC